jgi:hypothetical protein
LVRAAAASTIATALLASSAFAQDARSAAVIWHDRGDAAALDLSTGPGGKDREPGIALTFVKESTGGTSPKFDVEDERGTTWKVKLGEEAKSETAAARLLWAAGYTVDEDYYRATLRVDGLARLARGQQFVNHGDTVTGARLERETPGAGTTTWSWYDNPFIGTREFNGLRVMMALVNNWDLKEINNSATASSDGTQYRIADLGATFGRTGNSLHRSKGVIADYAATRFIDKVTATHVDLHMDSRPFFLSIFNIPNYRFRTRMESVGRSIPIADASWIGDVLGRLSSAQIADAFRAAGFSAAEIEAYTTVVSQRIAALQALGTAVRPPAVIETVVKKADKCAESTCRQVPLRETLTAIGLGTPYAHAIFGGFEQGAGIGGGLQLTTGRAIRGVELRAAALTSTQRYARYDLEAYVPDIGGSHNHADLWFSYTQRDTDFYGIGPRTADLNSAFAIDRRSYQGSLYRDVTTHTQGGVYAQVMSARSTVVLQPSASDVLSYGGFLAYDTRDNSLGLIRGVDFFARVASADGIGTRGGSAAAGWIETEVDARGYIPLGSAKTSLALRSRGQLKTAKDGREIPYYELSWLGGRQYLRGYHSYRFRDINVVLLSSELQQTVYAMTPSRGIDVFASADTGQVWGTAPFDSRNWESGLGGGLQYRHSRSIAARIEAGRSRERVAIYASLSRGF